MTIQQADSPARAFVRLVRTHGQAATAHSWVRLNQALSQAASLAIQAGLRFELDDFTYFHAQLRASYWIGAHERLYATACKVGNLSACRAYEHHYGFCPFELDDQRIYVGYEFEWSGEKVTCTSIHNDHLVACSYGPQGDAPSYQRKVKRRYKITHAEIHSLDKARAAAKDDAKMAKARAKAIEYARAYEIGEKQLALRVSDKQARTALRDFEEEWLKDILAKRFKKTDDPTLLDLLVVAHRWNRDQTTVKQIVDKIIHPIMALQVETAKNR